MRLNQDMIVCSGVLSAHQDSTCHKASKIRLEVYIIRRINLVCNNGLYLHRHNTLNRSDIVSEKSPSSVVFYCFSFL